MKSKIKQIIALIAIIMVLSLSSNIYINLLTFIDNNNESPINLKEDISTLSESFKSLKYHEDFNDTSHFWGLYDVSKRAMSLSFLPSDDSYTSSADPDMNYGSQSQNKVTNETGWGFSGESWMIGGQDIDPFDIFWDGSNWWVSGSDMIHKYDSSWIYSGVSYDISSQDSLPLSICWDGTNWWMLGGNGRVYMYDSSWFYTGISYDLASQDYEPFSICWDGTNWWMLGHHNLYVYQYSASWAFTGIYYDVSVVDNDPRDIFWGGGLWSMVGNENDRVYIFDASWFYTGFSYDISSQAGDPWSICWDGSNWWMSGYPFENVYKYDSSWGYTGISYNVGAFLDFARDVFWDGQYWWILGLDNQDYNWTAFKYSPLWEFTREQTNLGSILEEPIDIFFHEGGVTYVIGYNYSSFPIVARFSYPWDYQDVSFELSEDGSPRSICWDGSHWWMLGSENNRVYQYHEEVLLWGFTGVSYYIGAQNTSPRDIFWDGTNWWMLGGNGIVYKYTSSWEYTGISCSLVSQDNSPTSIFWDGYYWWMLGRDQNQVFKYFDPWEDYGFIKKEFPYLYANYTQNSNLRCYVYDGVFPSTIDSYTTSNFNEATITWLNQPSEIEYLVSSDVIGSGWATINLSHPAYYYLLKTQSNSTIFNSTEASNSKPTLHHYLSKYYQGGGILYCQTNESEILTLRSPNSYNFNLKQGDSIEIIFNTTSSNKIDFNLRYIGIERKSYTISEIGNIDFNTRTVELVIDEDMTIDQFEFRGLFDDTKNLIIDEIRIYTPSINIISPENKTYTGPMSGYYPASYGFENDKSGTYPDGWVIHTYAGTIQVIPELDSHYYVVEFYDDTNGQVYISQSTKFSEEYGTVEYWIRTTNVERWLGVHMSSGGGSILALRFNIYNSKWQYSDGSDHIISAFDGVYDPQNNRWYHIALHFEGRNGYSGDGYQDLSSDTWKVIIDNAYESEELPLGSDISELDHIGFFSENNNPGYYYYVDAVGYSWDPNYNIGDNIREGLLLSFKNLTALEWMGYSLDGQTNKTILGNSSIPLPQDGIHTLQVFGNDSIGNIHESNIRYFTVDINPPKIIINFPYDNDLFSSTSPNFDLTIEGFCLNTTWYTLDNGITNITFKGLAGPINQTEWSKRPDGPVAIKFYANNTYGKENSSEIIVNKDTSSPIVTINSPEMDEFFGSSPPTFNISITELNLNKTWYTLDNGITNITFSGLTGTINQEEWDGKSDEPVIIRFYANDTFGFKGYAERIIYKDITKPTSIVSFIPHSGTNIVNKSTIFSLTAADGLGSGISFIRYKINNSAWIDYTEPFDLSSYDPGYYLITYYSVDAVGNIEAENTILVKLVESLSKRAPEIIPGYNLYILISIFGVSIILLIKRHRNFQ